VVIDEFPYLAKANPELPSVIQAAFGPRREKRLRSRTRLLLCGSAMSFMGRLVSGTAPLRGRAGLEMIVPTLDYRLAAQFWGIEDPRLAVLLYSIVGGTPATCSPKNLTSGTTPSTTRSCPPSPRATGRAAVSRTTWNARPPTSPITCRSFKRRACLPATSTSSAPAAEGRRVLLAIGEVEVIGLDDLYA
jgi:hypothetical protein